MSGDAFNVNLTTDTELADVDLLNDDADGDEGVSNDLSIDARRRLEDRLEERRLQKDLQEFDFDF